MLIINFKNYVTGKKAIKLAKKIQKFLPKAIICPSALDIQSLAKKTKLKIYAQHISAFHKGRATGFIIPEFIKQDGAEGSLLNHSEHPLSFEMIKKATKEAQENKLKIILCASTISMAKKLKYLRPYAIAYEDKKLVGSGKSITKYKTKNVEKFAKLFKNSKIIPLCGAGISTVEDVKTAKKLGCKGVLIASAIANSRDPKKLLKQLK